LADSFLATVLFSVSRNPNKPTPLGVGKTQGFLDNKNTGRPHKN